MHSLRHLTVAFSIFATPFCLKAQPTSLSLGAFSNPILRNTEKAIRNFRGEVPWTVINASLADQKGDRWIASFEGLFRIPKTELEKNCFTGNCRHSPDDREAYFQHVEQTSGRIQVMQPVPAERFFHAYGLAEDGRGRIWVGSMQHGLHWFDGKTFRKPANPEILGSPFVRTLLYQKSAGLWVGTEKGLFQIPESELAKESPRLIPVSLNTKTGSIYSLQTEGNQLWLGCDSGLLQLNYGVLKRHIFKGLQVKSVLTEPGGKVWAGTENGLFEKSGEEFRAVENPGLAKARIKALHRAANGALWLAVWKEEQTQYQLYTRPANGGNDSWKPVQVTKTNDSAMPYFLQTDSQQRLWMGTNQGLYLVPVRLTGQKLEPQLFRSNYSTDPNQDGC